jgi:hypothetical protein
MSVKYQVSARRDPFSKTSVSPSTFSFKSNPQAPDPVVEKKLFYIIAQALTARGWKHDSEGGGEYLFSVTFGMEGEKVTGSRPTTTYNWYTKSYVVTQQAYSKTEYHRVVKIMTSHSSNPDSVIWTADCTSTGRTEDVLFAAQYMIPYAMERFPEEGLWKNREAAY